MTRPAFATLGAGAWSRVRPNRTHQWRPHSQLVGSPVFSRLDQLVDSISGVPAWPSFAYISWVTGCGADTAPLRRRGLGSRPVISKYNLRTSVRPYLA
jgi:hypothetical protein